MSRHPSPSRWLAGISLVALSLFVGAGMALTSTGLGANFLGQWLTGSAVLLLLATVPAIALGRLRSQWQPRRRSMPHRGIDGHRFGPQP